jgi:hypothetical protein
MWDNRGRTQALINCYFIQRIFDLHKKVKLMFALNYDLIKISNKGYNLK